MGSRLTVASRWRSVAATATGSSHRARDEPGQDAVLVRELDDGRVVIAVADGAGSAPLAAEGSTAAVEAAIDAVERGDVLEAVFEAAAAALGDDPAVRATTLLVVVLHDDAIDAGQVGDGFIVIRRRGRYEVALPAPEREFLNETTFLSSPSWRDELRAESFGADDVEGIAVMTDGLQLVAIDLATTKPFAGFFDPLFAWLDGDSASEDELAEFLAAPRLAERTDDDVTLALASPRRSWQ